MARGMDLPGVMRTYTRRVGSLAATLLVVLTTLALPFLTASPAWAQANVTGQWQILPYPLTVNPIHVALLRTGKILIASGTENDSTQTVNRAAIVDINAGTVTAQTILWDLFCNSMSQLPDGRMLIAGGNKQYNPFRGIRTTTIFDPATEKFIQVQDMAEGRWYPTNQLLPDGRTMTFGGWLEFSGGTNNSVEIYTVPTGWGPETFAPFTPALYPWLHLLPSGRVFLSGAMPQSQMYDPATGGWTPMAAFTYANQRTYGGSVLLPLLPSNGYAPRVIIFGGDNPATASAELIDLSQPSPAWQSLPAMVGPRIQPTSTILPDGTVFVAGGSVQDRVPGTATLAAQMFDPVSLTWSPAGSSAMPRLYHSVALLLPDGRVWMAGSNPSDGVWERRQEIWSPPYLFNASGGLATRPTITTAPAKVGYGASFSVQTPDAAGIGSVVLMRPGSNSHAFDFDQRMVGMTFTNGTGTLTVTSPPDANVAPPGYYMLFILNAAGVPSVSKMIQLSSNPANQPPAGVITQPAGDVTVTAGETVTFAGGAADPDGTVLAYQWLFPGGGPGSASVAAPGAVTFSTPGTYVVSLTVVDDQGANDPSPPSRTITVQGSGAPVPPTAFFASPAANATVAGTQVVDVGVTGGTPNYTYRVQIDGTQVFQQVGTSQTSLSFSWDTTAYGNAPHTLTLTVTDSLNQTSPATRIVTVNNSGGGGTAPFSAGLTSPAANAAVSGTVTVNIWREGTGTSPYTYSISSAGVVLGNVVSTSNHVTLDWNTTLTPNGPQTLTATIRDSANRAASTSANVTVSNAGAPNPPTASFTSPAPNATVSGSQQVGMAVSGGTANYSYVLRIDDVQVFSQTTASLSTAFTWDTTTYTNASHTLSLTVTDGNTQTSPATRTVTVQNGGGGTAAFDVGLTSPASGATVSGNVAVNVWLGGSGTAPYTYQMSAAGATIETASCSCNHVTLTWNTLQTPNGPQTLTASITDAQNRTATTSITVTVQNAGNPSAPVASFTAPGAGATVSGTVAVGMAVTGGTAPYTSTLSIDGTQVFSQTTSSLSAAFTWDTTTSSNASHTLSLTVSDTTTQTSTVTRTVTVQNGGGGGTAPFTVGLTSPAANATVSGTVAVNIWREGTGTAPYTYAISVAGQTPASASSSGNHVTLSWNTTQTPGGAQTLTARITDATGATATTSIDVTVQNAGGGASPLTASLTSPAAGATVSGTVSVGMTVTGGTPSYAYELTLDGAVVFQQTTAAGSQTFSWNTTPAADGSHTLVVTVTDAAAQTSSVTRTVTVQNGSGGGPAPFQVDMTSPSPGQTVSGTVAVNLWLGGSGTPPYTYAISAAGAPMDTDSCSCGHVTLAWDTRLVANGPQTLAATITDAQNRTASTTVTVTVQNP